MSFEQTIEDVLETMREPALTAEEQVERKIDSIVRELDELVAMAANHETVDLVEGQRIGIGQIISRAQLIGSFLMLKPAKLRVISHG